MTTRRLGLGLKCEYCQLFISNKIFPNGFIGVDFLNSRLCCLVKVLYSFDVRRFSNTVSGVNVTWRRIRARSNPESLISESDLEWLISGEFLTLTRIHIIAALPDPAGTRTLLYYRAAPPWQRVHYQ